METIKYAIKMEIDAKDYYCDQAEKFKDYPIARVFEILAETAMKHKKILHDYEERLNLTSELVDPAKIDNIYSNLADFKCEYTLIPKQLNAYQKALELEEKSIKLYTGFLKKTTDKTERQLLKRLIKEEKKHYELIDELIRLIERPETWVEDAEFGRREEY